MYVIHRNGKPFRTTYSQNAYIKKSHAKKLITEVVEREAGEITEKNFPGEFDHVWFDAFDAEKERIVKEFTIVTYIPETEV